MQPLMETVTHRYTLCYCTGPAKAISLWSGGGWEWHIHTYIGNLAGGIQPLGRSRLSLLEKYCKYMERFHGSYSCFNTPMFIVNLSSCHFCPFIHWTACYMYVCSLISIISDCALKCDWQKSSYNNAKYRNKHKNYVLDQNNVWCDRSNTKSAKTRGLRSLYQQIHLHPVIQ